jgi:HAD superfamily hydrolase (TIGR01450 family)
MKDYGLYVFDMDGVLFRGDEPTPGGPEVVREIAEGGALVRYLTNNSTKTRREFAEKLYEMGYPSEPAMIYTSAVGAAIYLGHTSAYVVGEEGLRSELESVGCNVVEDDPAAWVVVGACWTVTYAMIDEAQWRIRQGARFLATNMDSTYPIENGRLRPGAGSIVAAVRTAAEHDPDVVIGKPEPTLMRMIWSETEIGAESTLLIGDRLDTDVASAFNAGCDSALVLTGANSQAELRGSRWRPTYIYGSVADL